MSCNNEKKSKNQTVFPKRRYLCYDILSYLGVGETLSRRVFRETAGHFSNSVHYVFMKGDSEKCFC